MHDVNFWRARSFCPYCDEIIAWYDNIPVISWFLLRAKCRNCQAPISILYPFIELISLILLGSLIVKAPAEYLPAYFLFFSLLIISIRTDLETLLLSRYVTIFAAPIGILLASFGYLPISGFESLAGALFGYLLLAAVAYLFKKFTDRDGLGQGDIELLALIGSFTGIIGCWITLLIASIMGSVVGIMYQRVTQSHLIPFGPFLALAAMAYILLQHQLLLLLLPTY